MQISGCTSFKEWLVGARKVEKYLEEGYQAYYGHGDGVQTLEQVKQTIKIVEELIHQYKMGQIKEKSAIFPKEDVFPNVYYHKKYLK